MTLLVIVLSLAMAAVVAVPVIHLLRVYREVR